MAEIKSIDVHENDIELKLSVGRDEYKLIRHHTNELVVLPYHADSLKHHLTTGKLGNSNRIMLPKRLLESFKIKELNKKIPSNIFEVNGDYFLLTRIKKSDIGIPKFVEG